MIKLKIKLMRFPKWKNCWIKWKQPETKGSSVWKMKDEPLLRKFKMECSVRKVMLTAFWECCCLIYAEFDTDASKTRMTITKEMYFDTLMHMRNAIQEWRHGLLLWTMFLLPSGGPSTMFNGSMNCPEISQYPPFVLILIIQHLSSHN